MRENVWRFGMALALAGVGIDGGAAQAQSVPVRVTAQAADCVAAPVSLVVPASRLKGRARAPRGAVAAPCQVEKISESEVRLTFLVQDLKRGQSRDYVLTPGKGDAVDVRAVGRDAEVRIGGTLFTRYDATTGPTKPYLYPIVAFGGKHLTRRWPLEEVPDENRDHPHHRGLWFTHGAMNGVDFWAESGVNHPIGKSVHTGYGRLSGGAVQGTIEARTDWNAPDGKTIARDARTISVTPLPGGAVLLDFAVTVTAVGGPLVWGDTKEGTFAIRVPESMKSDKGGTLVNAEGLTNAALWGKPSPWNDYFGPVGGETLGMAIFDHPSNPRHPTTWHSRTYGLFAVNPFGLHDFDPAKKNDPKAGEMTTPEGQSVTFRYRVYFHQGDTKAGRVADAYAAWATPPSVTLL